MLLRLVCLFAIASSASATILAFNLSIWCSYMPPGGLDATMMLWNDGSLFNYNFIDQRVQFPLPKNLKQNGSQIWIRTSQFAPDFFSDYFYPRATINHNCYRVNGFDTTTPHTTEYKFKECLYGPNDCEYVTPIILDKLEGN